MSESAKALLLADLHLHHVPVWRWEWLCKFCDHLLAQGAEHPLHLFLLGDVFEVRDKVDSRVLNLFIELVSEWTFGDVVWISGQHDSYIPGRATLHGLSGFGVDVVDREVYRHAGTDSYFVPFCRKDEDYRSLLKEVPDGAVVFTHLPILEAIQMFNVRERNGISVKEFERFKHTFSGDIHCFHDWEKEGFTYVGAPSQRDKRDKNATGVYGLWYGGADMKRVETDCPIHIEVKNERHLKRIPDDRACIVTSHGVDIGSRDNVLQVVENHDVDVESVELDAGTGDVDQLLAEYMEANKPPAELDGKEVLGYGLRYLEG